MLILGCLGEPCPQRQHALDMGSEWSSGWYHNSAAALLENDRVVAAVEEERLTRRKHTGKFPFQAIEYCLAQAHISLEDLDRIAFGEFGGSGEYRDPRISPARIASVLRSRFQGEMDLVPKVRLVEHHVGHAMSAFVPSGFERALVFSCDGFGDGISGMVATACDGHLTETLDTYSFGNSLGRFYSSVLGFLGYDSGDEYKVMGLAPYGDPSVYGEFFRALYRLLPDGRFEIALHDQREMSARLEKLTPQRNPGGPFEPAHQHIARAIQDAFERIVFHVLSFWRHRTGERNICLAGGTAQNSTFNGRLLASGLFDQVYVPPAAHDAGIAMGAALQVQSLEMAPSYSGSPVSPYLGPGLPDPGALESSIVAWRDFVDAAPCPDICAAAANLLASGQVIGWVQGNSEFGPRALGNRSILADPRPSANRDRVNAAIKMREAYRPFAPAVLEDRASEYFNLPKHASSMPFMNFVVPVRESARHVLGAVTHVDGTARIQTVSRRDNFLFWNLLNAFERLTGLPVLLNTSFNNDAEPIVQSADDAIACFLTTALDTLIVGKFQITRRPRPLEAWLGLVPHLRSDVMLSRFSTPEPHSVAVHALVARNWHVQPISTAMFRLLEALDGKPAKAGIAPVNIGEEPANLGLELFHLWTRRLILLRPFRPATE